MAFRRGGGKRRRDTSEAEIIDGLRKCGAFVLQLSGDGAPDLLVRFLDRWFVFEVKNPKGSHLTKAQVQQQAGRAPYPIVKNVDECLRILLIKS